MPRCPIGAFIGLMRSTFQMGYASNMTGTIHLMSFCQAQGPLSHCTSWLTPG